MATRSMIGVQRENGTIEAIYCHWDGYPSNQGPILLDAYNGPRKIEALIRQGDLSMLGRKLVEDSTGAKDKDICYNLNGYDMTDPHYNVKLYDDIHDLRDRQDWCDYFYIHKEGRWYVTTESEEVELVLLERVLEQELETLKLTNPV